ncbi:benenodin family lasso peptide [Pseudothauera nasutitermitis]|uniref:Benenodin family lasso peptide n=1 Tax=Pseudothauera nasutitermitis TaxID=2565930 RepID=A0A4S4B1Q1_9RHOO|nr:benenodin family lasso peptide [Pseudothauera nasutitermitis]THF64868.1 benenodin family lasso peptide [Pseudothauera nasutitermitis]
MKDCIENTPRVEAQDDDIIVLGVASVETKGTPPMGPEGQGFGAGVGITE